MTSNGDLTYRDDNALVEPEILTGIRQDLRKGLSLLAIGNLLLVLAAPAAWSSGDDGFVPVWIPMALVLTGGIALRLARSRIRCARAPLVRRRASFPEGELDAAGEASPA